MYAFPRTLPRVPARRPSIESSAKIEMRALRSVGVMAAVVPPDGAGWPVFASGGRAPPQDHRAAGSMSARSRESRIGDPPEVERGMDNRLPLPQATPFRFTRPRPPGSGSRTLFRPREPGPARPGAPRLARWDGRQIGRAHV